MLTLRQADRPDMQAPPPSPTRTKARAFPSTIYDMPFDAFVDYLRTVYSDDVVEMMV